MKLISAIIICLFSLGKSIAQDTVITIKAGEDVSALYKHIYKYPVFSTGTVYFNDGTVAGSKMNYNLFLEAMQFIDEKGDTLVLANENTIKFIAIGEDSFYFDKGYLQLVSDHGGIALASAQRIKLLNEKNIGAFGISNSTGNIDNYNTLRANNTYTLKLNKDLIFSKESKFYFSKGGTDFIIANKRNLLKEFPNKKTILENYLTKHELSYDNEKDLINLFTYLASN